MADCACLVLIGGRARICLVRSNHRLMFPRSCPVIPGLRLAELSNILMLRLRLCNGDQGVEFVLMETLRLGIAVPLAPGRRRQRSRRMREKGRNATYRRIEGFQITVIPAIIRVR